MSEMLAMFDEAIAVDSARLHECEAVIERGLTTFVEVGQALLEIRESRLYRETHDTFEDYCRDRWGWSRQRAHQMIEASAMSTIVDIAPSNEAQARELARLKYDPDAVREVWSEVKAEHGDKVTASDVREAVDRKLGVDRGPTKEQRIAAGYTHGCEDCAEFFSLPVWHCPTCAHHWADPFDDICKNCLSMGEWTYRPGFTPDPDDEYGGGPRVGVPPGEPIEDIDGEQYATLPLDDAPYQEPPQPQIAALDVAALPPLDPSPEERAFSALVRLIGVHRLDPRRVADEASDPLQAADHLGPLSEWLVSVVSALRMRGRALRAVK